MALLLGICSNSNMWVPEMSICHFYLPVLRYLIGMKNFLIKHLDIWDHPGRDASLHRILQIFLLVFNNWPLFSLLISHNK